MVDGEKIEQLLCAQWGSSVASSHSGLESQDRRQVLDRGTWGRLQDQIARSRGDEIADREFALIAPSLRKMEAFIDVWLPKVGERVDGSPVWAFYTLIIKLLQEEKDALPIVPPMLREISHKTSILNTHFAEAPIFTPELKEVCVEFGSAVLAFLAYAVRFLRNDVPVPRRSNSCYLQAPGWQPLQARYGSALQQLDRLASRAEELLKVASRLTRFDDTVSRQGANTPSNLSHRLSRPAVVDREEHAKLPCIILPSIRTSRFFDRVNAVQKIQDYFDNAHAGTSFRSLALHGLGGVGKSTVALRYAEKKIERGELDALFWVHSEKPVSLKQSFTNIAMRLRLPDTQKGDHDENRAALLDWLQNTQCRCLIVYDNAEDPALLRDYWPLTSRCQALITTRNPNFSFDLAAHGMEITSWDKDTGLQFLLYLLTTDVTADLQEDEEESAQQIADELSGHALAISAIAGLIHKRSLSFKEFGKFYNQHRNEVHRVSDDRFSDLWEISFQSLEPQSRAILGVMSFLEPDSIPQAIFEPPSPADLPGALKFCSDPFGFSGAIETLLTLALVKRDKVSRTFSLHRLVQHAFRSSMSPAQKQQAFNDATVLVSMAFPRRDSNVAQLYLMWDRCTLYLQHVMRLKDSFREEKTSNPEFAAMQVYCDLNNACQRYLLELNSYEELDDLIEVNLLALESLPKAEQTVGLWGSLSSHRGQLLVLTGKAEEGVEWLKRSYEIRSRDTPFNPRESAWAADNAAMGIATLNSFAEATRWHEKARDHFREWSLKQAERTGEWPAEIMKNMGSGLVWSGHSQQARDLMNGALRQIDSTEPYNWAMAAYAHFGLGTVDRFDRNYAAAEAHFMEAQNLWLRGDQMRSDPFNGACMYRLGCTSLDRGHLEAAVKHLRDALVVTKKHKNLLVAEHMRCLFKLSEALEQEPRCAEEAMATREEAERLLRQRDPNAGDAGKESTYDSLVCLLWR